MPRTACLYRFTDQATWAAALAAEAWDQGTPPGVDLLVTGLVREPSDDPEAPGPVLPGWHVAGLFLEAPPTAWTPAIITDAPTGMLTWPRPAPTIEAYQVAIDAHVQATAQARSYNDANSCAGYVASTVPAWAAEASAFVAWRDQVYLEAFEALAAVQAGGPPPTVEALIASLPPMVWPA